MATSDAMPAAGAVSAREETATTEAPRMRPRRYIREIAWRHVVGILAVAFALFPISWIVMSSINTVDSLTTARFIPDSTTFANFTSLFEGCSFSLGMPPFSCDSTTPFPLWLWNTVKIGLIASTLQLFMATLAAYSFARLRWRGRRTGLIALLLIQMFPQFLAFVALFLLLDTLEETFGDAASVDVWVIGLVLVVGIGLTAYQAFKPGSRWRSQTKRSLLYVAAGAAVFLAWALVNDGFDYGVTLFPKIGLGTHTGLVLVYLSGAVGVNTWLIKGFMDSIPTSLDEAAEVDGATQWDVFSKIIVPLARPILIVIFMLTFVGLYNEFILAAILIQDVEQFTFATGLNLFVESEYAAKWGALSAAAVIGTTPILVIFWAMQDKIVSGLGGAVKG
jgi:ABC-type maltose transport system permease subunit